MAVEPVASWPLQRFLHHIGICFQMKTACSVEKRPAGAFAAAGLILNGITGVTSRVGW